MNSSSEDSRSSRSRKRRHTSKSKDKKSHHHRERSRHHHSTKKKSKESKHRSKDSEKSKKEIKKSKEKSHTHHSKHSSYHSDHSSKRKPKHSSSSSSSNHKNLTEDLLDKNEMNMLYPIPMKKNMFFPAMNNPSQFKYPNIPNLNHPIFPTINVQNINPMNAVMIGMNNNEGYNDKIVKDQNFLNSEEKLFDNIVSHEMSLKNLFSDCQFSEKYLGKILYRTIKKQTFDSNIVIFDESEDDGKKFVIPKQSEFIQKKIETLKINTQKVKFEGLGNIYKKIIGERRSEIEKENNNSKSNKNNE